MLDQLFPKYHHRFTQSPAAPWLQSFADWLVGQGYAHDPAHDHVSRLRRILERVAPICPDATFTVDDVNALFKSAIQEASPTQKILTCGTQRAFIRFLDARRQLARQAETARFGELTKRYEQNLFELRGFTVSTVCQHLATVSEFLAHAIPSDMPLATLAPAAVESFVAESGSRITRQSLQHTVARVRGFLRFCYDQGELPRRLHMIDAPRTYRDEMPPRALQWQQVLALLRSIDRSTKAGCRDHAMLYLMAHYGLRPSEIAALTMDSVDWISRTMKVEQRKTRSTLVLPLRESKFHKSRLVPLSPDARRELRLYLKQRLAPPTDTNPDSPLLCNWHGALRGYTGTGLSYGIQALFRAAHVQSVDGRHPRVHDFRHSFAVQAMLRWYRQGADVQSNLPKLAMYMGHVSIVSTAYYLKWVPALAEAASQRFETCFGDLICGGKP